MRGFDMSEFQHTAARRRLVAQSFSKFLQWSFQHTAARRRLESPNVFKRVAKIVSTHSRPKAAGD